MSGGCFQCSAYMGEDSIEGVCCYLYSCGLCDWTWLKDDWPDLEPCDYHKELIEKELKE